jgi:WD40 repeat protein
MMIRWALAAVLAAVLPTVSPGADKNLVQPIAVVAVQRKDPVTFEKDIEPILANKCQVCHSGSVKEGKLDLSRYDLLRKGGKRGEPIVPGKSADSLLVQLAGKTRRPFMPPRGEEPLTPEELALLKLWIDQGAKPPSSSKPRPKVLLSALPASVHPVRALALRPDKTEVAVGRANEIHLYRADSGALVRTLLSEGLTTADGKPVRAAHLAMVESLAYSPDGKLLASGSFQEVVLWDAATGAPRRRLTGFADRVVALAFSPDGKLLATGGGAPTEEGEIKLFDVASGNPVLDLKNGHSDTVFGVSFSPDGKRLATAAADKFVKIFEVPSGKLFKSFEGHTHHVLDVGWKADGKMLASAGADNAIKIWDVDKGEQLRTLAGHTKQVTRLAFKGKTAEIVTCGGDQTVRLWNVDNGNPGTTFGGAGDFLYAVAISADGQLVAAGGEEGVVRLYNGANGQLLKTLGPSGAAGARAQK